MPTEPFGNLTPQPESDSKNGFKALAENGRNDDGFIDIHDAIFPRLLFWTDRNHDGISQPKELSSLIDSGISHIDLNYTEVNRIDENYNTFHDRARVWDHKGAPGGKFAWDVYPDVLAK